MSLQSLLTLLTGLRLGLAVFGSVPLPGHLWGQRSLSGYVAVDARYVMGTSEGVVLEEAAGLAVAGGNALPLFDEAKL